MSARPGKSRGLLSDPNIAAWYSNLSEGSAITADIYLRCLGRFCEENQQTPQSLAGMDAKTAFNTLVTAVRKYRQIGFAGSMIKGYVKAVKSWFPHNDIEIKHVNVKGANKTPTLRNEQTTEPYVLNSVWWFCDERQAATIALLSLTGFRPQVLGSYKGTDGLLLSGLPELEFDNAARKITLCAWRQIEGPFARLGPAKLIGSKSSVNNR